MILYFCNILMIFVLQQSTGAYKAAARLASATPPPAHVLSRGIGWQVSVIYIHYK